jgi:hypothetical protein
MRRENADTHLPVIVRLVRNCAPGRTIQYSRDVNDRAIGRGVLDTRIRGYDDRFAATIPPYPCGITDILAQSRRPISTQSWVLRRSAMLTASQMPMAVSATVNARAATLASMR